MWQMVSCIPVSLNDRTSTPPLAQDVTLLSAKLSTSFFLESFIHAKEKLNIVQWVELLTKQVKQEDRDEKYNFLSWFFLFLSV